jgi:hypothetical protein
MDSTAPGSDLSAPTGGLRGGARWLLGALAAGFGVMTLVVGGKTLAGLATDHDPAEIVQFVLVFNVLAGAVYVATGALTLLGRPIAARLALGLLLATLAVFAAFGVQVALGGVGTGHTARAMAVRSAFWLVQWLALSRLVFAPPPRA